MQCYVMKWISISNDNSNQVAVPRIYYILIFVSVISITTSFNLWHILAFSYHNAKF